jgi:peroxiredoxin
MTTFYDLKADLPSGTTYDFEDLKGKVVLIVNVASQCGFTPQYKGTSFLSLTKQRFYKSTVGLQALYDKYKEKNFVIIGFPCNQVCLTLMEPKSSFF